MTLAVIGCESPLKKAKDEAILKLSENDPILLKEIVLETFEVESEELGSEAIDVEGGTILVITPDRRLPGERGVSLEYPDFSAQVIKFAGGNDFSLLPPSWGNDDLEKLRFICGASRRTIEAASDFNELKEAVALLTARGTVAPSGAFDRLVWLEVGQFSGLLSGSFVDSEWMELLMRPTAKPDANYLIQFRRKDGAGHDHVLTFLRSLAFKPTAEQAGAGQPATRSETKPEGNQNPNPKAEGRSRERVPGLIVRQEFVSPSHKVHQALQSSLQRCKLTPFPIGLSTFYLPRSSQLRDSSTSPWVYCRLQQFSESSRGV